MPDLADATALLDPLAAFADRQASEFLRAIATPDLFGVEAVSASVQFDARAWSPDQATRLGIELPRALDAAARQRKAEFIAGRCCARRALVKLGRPAATIVATTGRGAPVWPPGIVGSITHCGDFASAALALQSAVRGIGIDSERIMKPEQAMRLAAEIGSSNMHETPAPNYAHALRVTLVFSAKESLFKCLHPLVGRDFWFADAHVDLGTASGNDGTFAAVLLTDLGAEFRRGIRIVGRYRTDPPYVHTAIALRRRASAGVRSGAGETGS